MAWKIHWIKSVLSTVGKGNFYDKFWGNRQLQVEHLRVVECCVVWGVSEPSTKFETRESRQLWVGTAAIIVSCQSARIKSNIPLIPFVISILKCYLGLRGLQRVIWVNSILWISRSEITRGRAGEGRGERLDFAALETVARCESVTMTRCQPPSLRGWLKWSNIGNIQLFCQICQDQRRPADHSPVSSFQDQVRLLQAPIDLKSLLSFSYFM